MLEYKKEFKIPIELENPSELPNLVVKAYDYEMLGSNKLYASKTLDVQSILKNRGQYSFNEVVQLEGEESLKNQYRVFGFIYLQIKFLPEGTPDAQNYGIMVETLNQHIKSNRIRGRVQVHCVWGRGLVPMDSDTSDPFLNFKFANKEEIKTKHINGTLSPE